MPDSPQETKDFIKGVTDSWGEEASTVKLGEMTFDEFKQKVKPSLDYRAEIDTLETQLTIARQKRNNADVVSTEACLSVVNGVRSNPAYGENSALYKAMGYVPKNERRSGLVRPSDNEQPASQAA